MKQGAIRILQEELSATGTYSGPIDGQINAAMDTAAAALVQPRASELSGDPSAWSAARKRVAAFQLVSKDAGIDPGDIDGLWGSLTEAGYSDFRFFRETGELPMDFRDIVPLDVNPNGWPTDKTGQADLFSFSASIRIRVGSPRPQSLRFHGR